MAAPVVSVRAVRADAATGGPPIAGVAGARRTSIPGAGAPVQGPQEQFACALWPGPAWAPAVARPRRPRAPPRRARAPSRPAPAARRRAARPRVRRPGSSAICQTTPSRASYLRAGPIKLKGSRKRPLASCTMKCRCGPGGAAGRAPCAPGAAQAALRPRLAPAPTRPSGARTSRDRARRPVPVERLDFDHPAQIGASDLRRRGRYRPAPRSGRHRAPAHAPPRTRGAGSGRPGRCPSGTTACRWGRRSR